MERGQLRGIPSKSQPSARLNTICELTVSHYCGVTRRYTAMQPQAGSLRTKLPSTYLFRVAPQLEKARNYCQGNPCAY